MDRHSVVAEFPVLGSALEYFSGPDNLTDPDPVELGQPDSEKLRQEGQQDGQQLLAGDYIDIGEDTFRVVSVNCVTGYAQLKHFQNSNLTRFETIQFCLDNRYDPL